MTKNEFTDLQASIKASGESIHDYLANHDISPSTYYYYRKKYINAETKSPKLKTHAVAVKSQIPELTNTETTHEKPLVVMIGTPQDIKKALEAVF